MPFRFVFTKSQGSLRHKETKARSSWAHVHAAADEQVPTLTDDLRAVLSSLASGLSVDLIQAALEKKDADKKVLALLDWEAFGEDLLAVFTPSLTSALSDTIEPAARQLYADLKTNTSKKSAEGDASAEFVGRFDLITPEAQDWVKAHGAELVTQISDATKEAIRSIITKSLQGKYDVRSSSRQIRDIVGLTAPDALALVNFENALRGQSDWADIPQGLRDKLARSGLSQKAINALGSRGMPDSRINQVVQDYQARLIRSRAENIARTETLTASNRGQQSLWEQSVDQGLFDKESMERVWITTPDDRLCDECAELDGVTVGMDEDFPGGVLTPPLHPSCRCAVGLKDVKLAKGLTLETLPPVEAEIQPTLTFDNAADVRTYAQENYDDWKNKLTIDESNYLQNYMSSSYGPTNMLLRQEGLWSEKHPGETQPELFPGQDVGLLERLVKAIDSAIAKSPLTDSIVTYREVNLPRTNWSALVGTSWSDAGFMSTTPNSSFSFGRGSDAIFKMNLPQGTPAAFVQILNDNVTSQSEAELLLGRGLTFRIVSAEEVPDSRSHKSTGLMWHVEMELVV